MCVSRRMKSTLSRIALLALLLVPARAYAEEVKILITFPGASGPGPKDCPDNAGAVGPDHVVDFTNASEPQRSVAE